MVNFTPGTSGEMGNGKLEIGNRSVPIADF